MGAGFWERVDEAAREVRAWPKWKRCAASRVYLDQCECAEPRSSPVKPTPSAPLAD